MSIETSPFGQVDSQEILLFSMTNQRGNRVQVTNYGAILVSVEVPDRDGKTANINLGYPSLDGYLERHPYFGSTVGRFCNRIAKGKFTLEGESYDLAINNGPNHLHGGIVGFDKLIWQAETIEGSGTDCVRFTALSPDGQEGYPGNLNVIVEYHWDDRDELTVLFQATTDAPTVLNLTNHSYWNLSGAGNGLVLDHELQLRCDHFVAVDEHLIPTGQLPPTDGTLLDFKDYHSIGERIYELTDFEATKGYDHCFVINGPAGEAPRSCASIRDPASGRTMEVLTTQPGVQLYVGNHLESPYEPYAGFCLETQHYPDSPNQPSFPSTRLDPGQTFHEKTIHRFGVDS